MPATRLSLTGTLVVGAEDLAEYFFDAQVRDHFAADFAETHETVQEEDEAVRINPGYIPGVVPAVLQHGVGALGIAPVALHDIVARDHDFARFAGGDSGSIRATKHRMTVTGRTSRLDKLASYQ